MTNTSRVLQVRASFEQVQHVQQLYTIHGSIDHLALHLNNTVQTQRMEEYIGQPCTGNISWFDKVAR